jgi:hypothetical protein
VRAGGTRWRDDDAAAARVSCGVVVAAAAASAGVPTRAAGADQCRLSPRTGWAERPAGPPIPPPRTCHRRTTPRTDRHAACTRRPRLSLRAAEPVAGTETRKRDTVSSYLRVRSECRSRPFLLRSSTLVRAAQFGENV